MKAITVNIDGKIHFIRKVEKVTKEIFLGWYKSHFIHIEYEPEDGEYYVRVEYKNGEVVVETSIEFDYQKHPTAKSILPIAIKKAMLNNAIHPQIHALS